MKEIFILLSIIFLTSCSLKTTFMKPDLLQQKILSWTKKGAIYNSMEMKSSIFATYLNPIDKKYKDGEYFFVSIFIDNDFEDSKKYGLNNKNYTLILNNQKYTYKKELDKDSQIVKMMPFNNEWSHLYLLKFPKQKSNILKLELINPNYGVTTMKFQKQ